MGSIGQCFYNNKVCKAKVRVTIEAITNVLNSIVTSCLMNQSKGDWLLFVALTTSIALTIYMEVEFE
jgi:hypothetical protein